VGTEHLTDEELQEILDRKHELAESDVNSHLDTCEVCQERLKLYENVYAELASDEGFHLSEDFSAKVADRVGLVPSEPFLQKHLQLILGIASLAALALASILLFDISSIIGRLHDFAGITSFFERMGQSTLSAKLRSIDKIWSLVIPGIVVLFTIGLVDRVVRQQRKRPTSLLM